MNQHNDREECDVVVDMQIEIVRSNTLFLVYFGGYWTKRLDAVIAH